MPPSEDDFALPRTNEILASDIYEELGWALSAWGDVEAEMARLFSVAVSYDLNERGARKAFWAVSSFDGKLARAHAVMKEFDSDNEVPENMKGEASAGWPVLHQRLRKKKGTRNKLAHGVVRGISWTNPKSGRTKHDLFFLPFGNSYDDKNRPKITTEVEPAKYLRDPRPAGRMSKVDIESARKSFHALATGLQLIRLTVVGVLHRKEDSETDPELKDQ